VNSKNELILAYRLPCGKAGGLQILRCKGIAVNSYNVTLYALTLKPSGFCNVGVNPKSALPHSKKNGSVYNVKTGLILIRSNLQPVDKILHCRIFGY
jgi:hypothetical protein